MTQPTSLSPASTRKRSRTAAAPPGAATGYVATAGATLRQMREILEWVSAHDEDEAALERVHNAARAVFLSITPLAIRADIDCARAALAVMREHADWVGNNGRSASVDSEVSAAMGSVFSAAAAHACALLASTFAAAPAAGPPPEPHPPTLTAGEVIDRVLAKAVAAYGSPPPRDAVHKVRAGEFVALCLAEAAPLRVRGVLDRAAVDDYVEALRPDAYTHREGFRPACYHFRVHALHRGHFRGKL